MSNFAAVETLILGLHVLELVQKLLTAEDLPVQVDMGFVLHEAAICFSGSHRVSFLILMTCFSRRGVHVSIFK